MPINETVLFSKIDHLINQIRSHNEEIKRNEQNRRSFLQLALDILSKRKAEEPEVAVIVDKTPFVKLALDILSKRKAEEPEVAVNVDKKPFVKLALDILEQKKSNNDEDMSNKKSLLKLALDVLSNAEKGSGNQQPPQPPTPPPTPPLVSVNNVDEVSLLKLGLNVLSNSDPVVVAELPPQPTPQTSDEVSLIKLGLNVLSNSEQPLVNSPPPTPQISDEVSLIKLGLNVLSNSDPVVVNSPPPPPPGQTSDEVSLIKLGLNVLSNSVPPLVNPPPPGQTPDEVSIIKLGLNVLSNSEPPQAPPAPQTPDEVSLIKLGLNVLSNSVPPLVNPPPMSHTPDEVSLIKLGLNLLSNFPVTAMYTIAGCIARLEVIDSKTNEIHNETKKVENTVAQIIEYLPLEEYKNEVIKNFTAISQILITLKDAPSVNVTSNDQGLYCDKLTATILVFNEFIPLVIDQFEKIKEIHQNTIAKRIGDAASNLYSKTSELAAAAVTNAPGAVATGASSAARLLYNAPGAVATGASSAASLLYNAPGRMRNSFRGGRLPQFSGGALDYQKIDSENRKVLELFISNYIELVDRIKKTKSDNNLDLSRLLSFTQESSHYFELTIDIIQLMIANYQPPPTFFERTGAILSAIKLFPEMILSQIVENIDNDTCKADNPDPANPAIRAIGKFNDKCHFIDIKTNKIIQ
jgi:hypothetical protein